jgi:hypothetical protein
MTTARESRRCPGSGEVLERIPEGTVITCDHCLRPVRLMRSAQGHGFAVGPGRVPPHGSVRTRNTRRHDDLLRMSASIEREGPTA